MSASSVVTKDYENNCGFGRHNSKAKQTQFELKPMLKSVSFSELNELRAAMCSTGQQEDPLLLEQGPKRVRRR